MNRVGFSFLILAIVVSAQTLLAQHEAIVSSPENLGALRHVRGRVIDDLTGRPLSDATVRLAIMVIHSNCSNCDPPLPSPPEDEPPREFVTGKDGTFVFDNVPITGINVSASKANYSDVWPFRRSASDSLNNFQVNDEDLEITLRLAPTASISGILLDHKGVAITKGATITLWCIREWAGWPRLEYGGFAEFSADGVYHFRGLQPGRYYLVANPPDSLRGPENVRPGRVVGEVPSLYPTSTLDKTNAFFTLHEGEQARINVRFQQKALHHVTVIENQGYADSLIDVHRARFPLKGFPEKPLEAWLPNGTYVLSAGREGDISGPMPFDVAGSDLMNLPFSVFAEAPRIEVPVEIMSLPPNVPTCSGAFDCGFVSLRLVRFSSGDYVEVVSDTTQVGRFDGTPPQPQPAQSVSLIPGKYTVALNATLNLYAKSITCGPVDFAVEPLIVQPGDTPDPIHVVLAEGALADGIVSAKGKPAKAWVYAIADDIEPKVDFHEFQPVLSGDDGKFHMQGLAPGSYLFFASDFEIPINVHDPTEVALWRSRGKTVRVEVGKTANLALAVIDTPEFYNLR